MQIPQEIYDYVANNSNVTNPAEPQDTKKIKLRIKCAWDYETMFFGHLMPKYALFGKDAEGLFYVTKKSLIPGLDTPTIWIMRWNGYDWREVLCDDIDLIKKLATFMRKNPDSRKKCETLQEHLQAISLFKMCASADRKFKCKATSPKTRHEWGKNQIRQDVWENAAPMRYGEMNGKREKVEY